MRAVESHVDHQLATFAASVRSLLGGSAQDSFLDGMIGFYYRYNPSDLAESGPTRHDGDADEGIVQQPVTGDLSSLGLPPTAPPACQTRPAHPPGKLSRLPSRIEAGSSVFLSTWSLLAVPRVTPDHGTIKTQKQKTSKKNSKNAVVDHAEPRVFQRMIGLSGSLQTATTPSLASQCSSNTLASEHIASLVGSLLDLVETSAVAGQTDKADDSSPLRLLTWRNPPLNAGNGSLTRTNSSSRPSSSGTSQQNDLIAWQHGHGILYCLVPSNAAHCIANNAGVRLQVDKMLATMEKAVGAMLSA